MFAKMPKTNMYTIKQMKYIYWKIQFTMMIGYYLTPLKNYSLR